MKDSAVSSIYHDPSDLGIIDPHPDHPQGTHPKSHNWKASEQLAIYKHGQGVEVAYTGTMKQLQLVIRAGLDPRKSSTLTGHIPTSFVLHTCQLNIIKSWTKQHSLCYFKGKRPVCPLVFRI